MSKTLDRPNRCLYRMSAAEPNFQSSQEFEQKFTEKYLSQKRIIFTKRRFTCRDTWLDWLRFTEHSQTLVHKELQKITEYQKLITKRNER